jgi:protein-tyrosine phosphatase
MQNRIHTYEGVLNFRDFGGYDTGSGRVVSNTLYRSASFQGASDADAARLNQLGVRVLVDLRLPVERQHEPNRWPGEGCRVITHDDDSAVGLPPHLEALLRQDVSADSVREYMRGAYRGFPFKARHITLFRAWFAELAGEGGPAIVHCAAGKDRTGTLCALTLHTLGVDRDAIMADYELTNATIDVAKRLPKIQARMEERLGRSIDAEALAPMLGVEVEYLLEAFAAIEAQHGSLDAYLEDVLGVDARVREKLRERYVA